MPGKSRSTPNSTTDSGYNNSSSQSNPKPQSSSSSRECKRLFEAFPFSFLKHVTSFSSLLFQRMTQAVLFYDDEGKRMSISLQCDYPYISRYSSQYCGLVRHFRGSDSPVCHFLSMSSKPALSCYL